ncbi:MAG: hypothetical protein AB1644_07705 [Candidatus Zixiibacteriota bacterium]
MVTVIRAGVSTFRRNLPIWYGLYVGKLALSLLVAVPVLVLIHAVVDRSVFAQAVSREWSLGVISELVAAKENLLSSFMLMTLALAAAAFLLKQFLNGGIYTSLVSSGKPGIRRFFAECGGRFTDHIRISLIMAPIYLALAVVALVVVSLVPDRIFGLWGNAYLHTMILKVAITYVIILLGSLFSDVVRLHATVQSGIPVGTWFKLSLNYVGRHGVQTCVVYLVYFAPMVICWLLCERLALVATSRIQSLSGVVLELLLFQICSLFRTGQALLSIATLAPLVATHAERAVTATADSGIPHD